MTYVVAQGQIMRGILLCGVSDKKLLFAEERRVFYLDDFMDVLEGIHPSYYLMIDTIVASQGR